MGLRKWLGLRRKDDIAARMKAAPESASVMHDGILLHVAPRNSPIDLKLSEGAGYEHEVSKQILAALRTGDVAVDVGAHCGHHTASMIKAVGGQGIVVAIEPAEERFHLLQKSFEGMNNVHLFQVGLSSSDGVALLENTPMVSARIVTSPAPDAGEIKLTTLPNIMRQLGIAEIDLMKMDIEGHECEAIIGLEPVIGSIKAMIIEVHTQMILESYGAQKLDRMLSILDTYPHVIDMKNGRRLANVSGKAKSKGRRQFFLSR